MVHDFSSTSQRYRKISMSLTIVEISLRLGGQIAHLSLTCSSTSLRLEEMSTWFSSAISPRQGPFVPTGWYTLYIQLINQDESLRYFMCCIILTSLHLNTKIYVHNMYTKTLVFSKKLLFNWFSLYRFCSSKQKYIDTLHKWVLFSIKWCQEIFNKCF
jgi:hypothetical protein